MVRKIRRRRDRSDGSGSPINHEAVRRGTIPWTYDDLGAALEFATMLRSTPHDDWDRSPRRFGIQNDDGSVDMFQFNTDKPLNQLMGFVADRCREQDLDRTASLSHGMRMFEVLDFLQKHEARLLEAELMIEGEAEGESQLSSHLIEVLATMPYTRPTGKDSTGGQQYTFDPDDVIIEAGRRHFRYGED